MADIDNNGNYCPSIYTRNTTNSPTHIEQVIQTLESSRFFRVSFSSYLDKDLLDISEYNPWKHAIENQILPLMNYRSTLPVDSSATLPNYELVFVYDIEEITAISDRHMNELEILVDHIDSCKLYYLVEYVLFVLEFPEVSDMPPDFIGNIEDVYTGQTDGLKLLAPKFSGLQKLYNDISNGFDRRKLIISNDLLERCTIVEEERKIAYCKVAKELQKIYNQRWKTVDKCLKLVKKKSEKSTKKYANVVLSRDGVAYGASEILASGHGSLIELENVYSTDGVSNEAVFERIQRRFGNNCTLIYITSFPERASIPEKLNIPIWHVTSNDSIRKLYETQRDILLR